MVGIHDEAIYADIQEMVHGVGDDGAASDLQEGLRASLRQRPEPSPQAGAQNKSSLEASQFQC